MKKTFILAAIIAISHSVNAQETVEFGLKAGVHSSTINSYAEGSEVTNMHSFYAGGTAAFPVSKSFAIQTELLYSREGADLGQVDLELNTIRLPILFQYRHNSGFHVEAGPQIGIVIKGKSIQEDTKAEDNVGDFIPKTGASFAIGFGYRMQNGLGIDFRYAKGIDNTISGANSKLILASGGLSFVF
jgi:hypothetical protein